MVLWIFWLAAAMKVTFCFGSKLMVSVFPSGVVIFAPASCIISHAAAMSVVRSFPRMSMKASVVPSAT